jgi:predicted RNA binding protein YcfA (HicA-like mRNA interferase family)
MKLPRNVSADELIKKLKVLGYSTTRQSGSHIRLTTHQKGQHHITVPNHNPLKIGTLSAILSNIAEHLQETKEEIIKKIF